MGVPKSQRGSRTDEMLDIMIPLLEGETVTYHGRYYSIDDVSIEPRTPRRPEIWIGGGSQLADPKSPDLPRFVESVKARVMRTDGWIPRPTCPPDEIARDWRELQDYYREHGRDPRECVVAHENFMHLVLTNDPAEARRQQHEAFLKVMSSERGPQYLETVYLFGTPDEIIASLQARIDAGVEYFMLHTMTPDPAQLQNWIDEIIPNLNSRSRGRRDGVTQRVVLIGKPLKRKHSAVMHNAAFAAAGIDARYEAAGDWSRTTWRTSSSVSATNPAGWDCR